MTAIIVHGENQRRRAAGERRCNLDAEEPATTAHPWLTSWPAGISAGARSVVVERYGPRVDGMQVCGRHSMLFV